MFLNKCNIMSELDDIIAVSMGGFDTQIDTPSPLPSPSPKLCKIELFVI